MPLSRNSRASSFRNSAPSLDESLRFSQEMNPEFKNGLRGFLDYGFTNKLYTDLTLRCQGREFHVHRVVICLQSGYFTSACRQAPSSADSSVCPAVIDLGEEDNLDHVTAMIHFFYTYDYRIEDIPDFDQLPPYQELVFHVEIYVLAEKYRVMELKKLAWAKFIAQARHQNAWRGFPLILWRILKPIPASDRWLRSSIFSICREHIQELMEDDTFKDTADRTPGFWRELMEYSAPYVGKKYRCTNCRTEFLCEMQPETVGGETLGRCMNCRETFPLKHWAESIVRDEAEEEERANDHVTIARMSIG
ncbi:uncharacterized protein IWZ02DRAFT_95705 [Phyllosticta citriasiana]|uniref:uncharacterized protein n=1 Tax=Phyllosticta citriasiana TaxID=595635 RepID=UPI0030FDD8C1